MSRQAWKTSISRQVRMVRQRDLSAVVRRTILLYDHANHRVPRPTIVHDKQGVNDPHDNPSIAMDEAGYIWVFVSGRGRGRSGFIYRAAELYSVEDFQLVKQLEITYPQPW